MQKAYTVCDGSTCQGHDQIISQTCAPTLNLVSLDWAAALAAHGDTLVVGSDILNAFLNTHTLAQEYFMQIDIRFCEWWCRMNQLPVLQGLIFLILGNL